ncbi:hypothetical protein JAAARDRAFT_29557 [Jaapia argillacea MUCL 33604]|uniref:Poly [ADP-ribose] polymerase n=1 Tax=Jaapia argillacea MUCL 33604 TaxID=933084 RepID=A0A067Q9B6_9AGAM|nr:hypothetical protein JAAARDRAFT_29557 [Jaapia argillacea MUCL 33604]
MLRPSPGLRLACTNFQHLSSREKALPLHKRFRPPESRCFTNTSATKKPKVDQVGNVAGEIDDGTPTKMVTAPVDPESGNVGTHQVLSTPEGVWDATLSQTNINKNANKFYIMQLLHPNGNPESCTLYNRWGRTGEIGQSQRKGPFEPVAAVREFKRQFKSKTATSWGDRVGMTAKKGHYYWIERSFEDDDHTPKAEESKQKEKTPPEPESTLAVEIQTLCNLIFSEKLMNETLSSMNYDANKLPLGKLAKSTILDGFAALKVLAEVIQKPDGDAVKQFDNYLTACEELSGRYYSIIPHAFGRNRRPTIIAEMSTLKKELELLDALGDMEIAKKLINSTIPVDEHGNALNPLDAHFRSLGLSYMEPVNPESREFAALEKYAHETHGAHHSYFKAQVQHAFRVERKCETDAWNDAGFDKTNDGDRLLLWHGSRSTNFAGILSQGLRIAPPEAPASGYMFGKGVYFADMMSKSVGYCHASMSDQTGLLLLCEVVAKPFLEEVVGNYDADEDCMLGNKMSTKGMGKREPAAWQDAGEVLGRDDLRGCHMPTGRRKRGHPDAFLRYNEYIVYDVAQIRLRYLLMIKID